MGGVSVMGRGRAADLSVRIPVVMSLKNKLPVTNIEPAILLPAHLLEVSDFGETETLMQSDTGDVGQRDSSHDAVDGSSF